MRRWPLTVLLVASGCDETPQRVNQLVESLTPLPRIPSDLAFELKGLHEIATAAPEESESKHIILARNTLATAYVDGLLAAEVEGRSTAPLTDIFKEDSGVIPGASQLIKWLPKGHEYAEFLKATADPSGTQQQGRMATLSLEDSPSGKRARLLLALAFKQLLDGDTSKASEVAKAYPYPCPSVMASLARGDIPDPKEDDANCPVTCKAFSPQPKPKSDARTRRLALRQACSPKSLGLRAPEEYRYAGPRLAPLRFALVHGETNLRRARKDDGALADRARRFLSALRDQARDRAVIAPYPGWFGPGEFRHGVVMRFSRPLKGAQRPRGQRFASIDKHGNIRVGLQPGLAVSDQGVRFLDLESELAWPGRLVRRRPDPMFPAPSGDTLSDALNGLTLRAQTYLPDAGQRPLLLILSRGAPAKTLGRVLSYLPRGSQVELGFWDRGIRSVTAHVGWTRTSERTVDTQRDLDNELEFDRVLPTRSKPSPSAEVGPRVDGGPGTDAKALAILKPKTSGLDGGPSSSKDGSSQDDPPPSINEDGERRFDAGQLNLGATGKIRLARSGKKTQVTMSGKEILFTDLAGDARLQLAGYHSSRRGDRMKAWRQRLATLSATLPEDARVLLYIRKDAPIDALIELISALSPRSIDLSLPHERVKVLREDLYPDLP